MIDRLTKKWIRTKADETAAAAGCRFDADRADHFREFCERFIRHSKGQWAGQPLILQQWQQDEVFAPLFGWVRKDGTRRFRTAYIEIPKKNGKSTMASAVGLYLLVADDEPGAEVFSLGVTEEQAKVVHSEAVRMVKKSKALRSYLKLAESTNEIRFPRQDAVYKTLAFGADAAEGKNANGIICDELHAWKGNSGRDFYSAVEYAGAARRQPLNFTITTAGDDTGSVCWDRHQYAIDILEGRNKTDTAFFAYVRAAKPSDNLDDPEVWKKANPSLGTTINLEDFANDHARAKAKPSTWNKFKRYRLDIWTSGSNPALSGDDWEACAADFTEADLVGRECWGGLDLSRTRDMTAFALVFDGDRPGEFLVLVWFWLPRGTLEDPSTPEEFREWVESGDLNVTGGNVTDYDVVEDFIVEAAGRFRIHELAYDPYFAEELTQRVAARTSIKRVAFGQTGPNFAGPTSEFERMVIDHAFRHNGSPVLAWQAGNVEFKTDSNNNKRPMKPGGREVKKIDGIVAAIQAIARRMAWQDGGDGCAI